MKFLNLSAFFAVFLLSGCAFFEAIAPGFSRLDRQLRNQPDVYVARSTRASSGDFQHRIDRITVVRNREDSHPDVEFEGFRFDFASIGERFTGGIELISLRNDNARLAALAFEEIPDVTVNTEFSFAVIRAPEGTTILRGTDGVVAANAFEICFDPAAHRDALNAFLRDQGYVRGGETVDIEWDYMAAGGGEREEFEIFWKGWTRDGHAMFSSVYDMNAIVRVDGDLVVGPEGADDTYVIPFDGTVVYSSDTGRVLRCGTGEESAEAGAPTFAMRETAGVRGRPGLVVVPPGEDAVTLYNLSSPRTRMELFTLPPSENPLQIAIPLAR